MANSPKLIAVPPLALPPRSGWCCLRCLTRRGMSMAQLSVFSVASGAATSAAGLCAAGGGARRTGTTLRALAALTTLLALGQGLEGRALGARAAHVTLVD